MQSLYLLYEQARASCKKIKCDLPFSGVPILLKDLGSTCANVEMTWGSNFLKNVVPDHDSELISRFRKSGMVFIGKTNAAELGVLPTTESSRYGATRNPWNLARTAGGSSGGAAAAVAAGLVPIAHANDGGGSIRIPSACCGVFGLKPTRARTPLGPDLGDIMNGMVVEHVITRSVRDSAAVLDAIHGPGIGDPYYAPSDTRLFVASVTNGRKGLRIGFHAQDGGNTLHPDCDLAVHDAARLCSSLGHYMEEATPTVSMSTLLEPFMTVWAAGVAAAVGSIAFMTGQKPTPDMLEPMTWMLFEMGNKISAGEYLMSITHLQQISRQIARSFQQYDLLMTATTSEPAPLLGVLNQVPADRAQFARAYEFTNTAALANLTGQPSMTVPLHKNSYGLPVGVQFTARAGDEYTLFDLAGQLEIAKPWAYQFSSSKTNPIQQQEESISLP